MTVHTLPLAPWTRREDLAALIAAIDPLGGDARYVGGSIRDTLLGLPVSDIDIATPLEPREVMKRLQAARIRAVPTGIEHGTITAVLPEGKAEITTLRRDVSTDGRRATVAFARSWEEDAARRDFTINALYADPRTFELFDYHGGRNDLAARRVRFIGDARQRIREDHLRILRYFRFQARFGSLPADSEAEAACAELAGSLKALSRERVAQELLALLTLPDPGETVTRMAELGVLAQVLPQADDDALRALVAAERREEVAPDAIRRLAALLPADAAIAEQTASRLRLSLAQRKRLVSAASREILPITGSGTRRGKVEGQARNGGGSPAVAHPGALLPDSAGVPPARSGEEARALAYRIGREEAIDRLLLKGLSIAPLRGWDTPVFPLKGGEVVVRGVAAGPEVARLLRQVEGRWIAEGFPDRARVLALLDEELAHR